MDPAERTRTFEAWLSTHGAILERTARGFAVGADRDDLFQELLLAVWKAVPAFRAGAQVSTFLYRVAHNAALTWSRSRRRRGEREAPLELASAAAAAAPSSDEARLARLYAAIHALPPLDRSLVLLSLDELSYAEMATLHGLTPSNVGARLTRARQALAATLRGEQR
jgi:RNA polymerase sigma factor (sigma-70 family)